MVGAQVQSGGWVGVKRTVLVVLLVVCGCVVGGCSGDVAEKGSAGTTTEDGNVGVGIPVRTEDGRMLQPAGHRGLWFESEPEDPLDHVVWVSQRYVGLTIPVAPLGERAWSPGGAHLPDVCAPEIVDRMVEMGFVEPVKRNVGPGFLQCLASAPYENTSLRDATILWGSFDSNSEIISTKDLAEVDKWGFRSIYGAELSHHFGCISAWSDPRGKWNMISYPLKSRNKESCVFSRKTIQIILNILGGSVVSI